MAWKNCFACGRSYNDLKGGCTNLACKAYVTSPTPNAGVVPKPSPFLPAAGTKSPPPVPSPLVAFKAPVVPQASAAPLPSKHEVEVVPWNAPPVVTAALPAPVGIPLAPQPFTLTVYRGEKSEWWPRPELRLSCGMTLIEPWQCASTTELFEKLTREMRKNAAGTPDGYAQYLRAEGRPYALATARTKGGAFIGYNYVLEIPNVRTFFWGPI